MFIHPLTTACWAFNKVFLGRLTVISVRRVLCAFYWWREQRSKWQNKSRRAIQPWRDRGQIQTHSLCRSPLSVLPHSLIPTGRVPGRWRGLHSHPEEGPQKAQPILIPQQITLTPVSWEPSWVSDSSVYTLGTEAWAYAKSHGKPETQWPSTWVSGHLRVPNVCGGYPLASESIVYPFLYLSLVQWARGCREERGENKGEKLRCRVTCLGVSVGGVGPLSK